MEKAKKVIVIGAGFSGLSAASHLAKAGFQVTVLEKHDHAGGRARVFEQEGFLFDMGPSWYWMPDVFDRYFSNFGKKTAHMYELQRLSPSYRVFWQENDQTDVPADLRKLAELFANARCPTVLAAGPSALRCCHPIPASPPAKPPHASARR